ncbi:MAG: hypothetical protein QHH74_06210 [Spirochaetota bacterium]|nr:hypothetical protein [Spirochaetota bacterium]
MFKKTVLAFCISVFLSIFLLPFSSQAQVNSGDFGLILNGGVGTGSSMYGVILNTTNDSSSTLGVGPGSSFNAGFMANFNIIAIHSQLYYVTLKDLEWEQEVSGVDRKFKTEGSGHFWTWDGTIGIKALTEEGDMGYTHLYVGFRIWKVLREEDKKTVDGVSNPLYPPVKQELTGNGFIVGIRDFSTLPLGSISLALQTGLWLYKAPLSTFKQDGTEIDTTADQNIGFGFEIGGGLAFEDIGLSTIVGLRMDVQATEIKLPLNIDAVAGSGYAQFFFAVSKEFGF